MQPRFLPLLLALSATFCSLASAQEDRDSGSTVIREMNLARQNPALYATYLEDLRAHFNGTFLVLPGRTRIYTKEGLGAVDEAIRFLKAASPQQSLVLSPGMCKSAADHCAEQAGGAIGHGNPASRLKRYGSWSASWGENISYGKNTAREVVMALIIDDGLPARKHRKNIFNPNFNYAGAAFGPHARYRSVCSIDFAGHYAERGQTLAQNF